MASPELKAQADSGKIHLPDYNNTFIHWGFTISINWNSLAIKPIPDLQNNFADTLKSVNSSFAGGFNLGISTDMRLCNYLRLRFMPDLSFAERDISYSFAGTTKFTVTKKIAETFLDFPLDLKLTTKRYKNIDLYALGGGKYSVDLATTKDTSKIQTPANEILKLERNNYACEAGIGVEFYLTYFKFGIEGTYAMGLRNLLIKDTTVYTQSLEYLKSKVFLLSFTFEG